MCLCISVAIYSICMYVCVCVCSCPPPSLLSMPTGVMPLSLMMQQNNLALMRSLLSHASIVVLSVIVTFCHVSLLHAGCLLGGHCAQWVVCCVHHIPLEQLPINIVKGKLCTCLSVLYCFKSSTIYKY